MTPKLALIVAIAENGVIGKANGLPWHLSSDLKRFRALTIGKPMLMGRKTFDSIGRVLPGRDTIVVSRDLNYVPPQGVYAATSVNAGLELARTRAGALNADEIMLAGGAELFAALIDHVDRIYATWVAGAPEGDVYFPSIDWSQWQEVKREDHQPQKGDDAAFSFVDYVRTTA